MHKARFLDGTEPQSHDTTILRGAGSRPSSCSIHHVGWPTFRLASPGGKRLAETLELPPLKFQTGASIFNIFLPRDHAECAGQPLVAAKYCQTQPSTVEKRPVLFSAVS
jgi:hypothetical protein